MMKAKELAQHLLTIVEEKGDIDVVMEGSEGAPAILDILRVDVATFRNVHDREDTEDFVMLRCKNPQNPDTPNTLNDIDPFGE